MSTSKKSQPIPESAVLRPRLTEVQDKLEDPSSAETRFPRGDSIRDGHKADLERRYAELRDSEVRYRRLFETAKDGILILDGDTGQITDANPFLQDLLGYSKDELIGKALWEIGPVKDIPASREAMRQLQNNDYIRYEDIPLETKAGERRQVEFVSNVYLVNDWKVIQCNIRDITARKLAEAQLHTTNDELVDLVDEIQWRERETQLLNRMDEIQWRERETQLLNRMNELLQSCMTQAEAYRVITLSAGVLFPGYNGCLAILHDTDQHLEVVARWGLEAIMQSAFSLEDCWALRLGQLHEVVDQQTSLLCEHFTHPPPAGSLCLPLTVQGETLGILCLTDNTIRKGRHQPDLKQLAMTVGETVKLSLSNLKLRDQLRQQAIHDQLTGLYNQRYLDEALPRELHMAQRRKAPLCVVMLDIDGFKQFNDSFGHGPGDTVLREFGGILHERLRKSDISCRYGGDEFVLVLPDSSIADTQERVEQIRLFLKLLEIHYGEQVLGAITLSAGIAQTPQHGTTASELLRAADEARYAAKQAGRDRIVVYQAPPL